MNFLKSLIFDIYYNFRKIWISLLFCYLQNGEQIVTNLVIDPIWIIIKGKKLNSGDFNFQRITQEISVYKY